MTQIAQIFFDNVIVLQRQNHFTVFKHTYTPHVCALFRIWCALHHITWVEKWFHCRKKSNYQVFCCYFYNIVLLLGADFLFRSVLVKRGHILWERKSILTSGAQRLEIFWTQAFACGTIFLTEDVHCIRGEGENIWSSWEFSHLPVLPSTANNF